MMFSISKGSDSKTQNTAQCEYFCNINQLWLDKRWKDALDKRRKELKHLETEHDKLKVSLVNSTTWMKSQLLLFSIKRLQSNLCKKTLARHEKKLGALIINKRVHKPSWCRVTWKWNRNSQSWFKTWITYNTTRKWDDSNNGRYLRPNFAA